MDFDYKNYSLSKLEEWVNDAITCSEASPQEVYDTIKKVVQENFDEYQKTTERCRELLNLLNGHQPIKFNLSDYSTSYGGDIGSTDDYIHFNIDPAGNKIDFCGVGNTADYCKSSWNDFWNENTTSEEHSKYYYEYDRNDLYRENPFVDKVVKWQLPVEVDTASEEYYVNFPDDLLEAANLKEGDVVEWIDNNDGTYTLKKVENPTDKNTKD